MLLVVAVYYLITPTPYLNADWRKSFQIWSPRTKCCVSRLLYCPPQRACQHGSRQLFFRLHVKLSGVKGLQLLLPSFVRLSVSSASRRGGSKPSSSEEVERSLTLSHKLCYPLQRSPDNSLVPNGEIRPSPPVSFLTLKGASHFLKSWL